MRIAIFESVSPNDAEALKRFNVYCSWMPHLGSAKRTCLS